MKHFEHFIDDWFLPLCLVIVSGWLSLRQKFIFDEHAEMLKRINKLETDSQIIDTKVTTLTDTQQEIKADVKEGLKLLQDLQIKLASKI